MTRIVPPRKVVSKMFLQAASPALAFMLGLGTVFGTSSAQAKTYKETLL